MIPAAKASYELFVGPIPSGKMVQRTCRVPLCVAPHHLIAESPLEGQLRRDNKHRGLRRLESGKGSVGPQLVDIEELLVLYPLLGTVPYRDVAAKLGVCVKTLTGAIAFWIRAGLINKHERYRHQQHWRISLSDIKVARGLVGVMPIYAIAKQFGISEVCLRKSFQRYAKLGVIQPYKTRLSRYHRSLLELPEVDDEWRMRDRIAESEELSQLHFDRKFRIDPMEHT